MPATSSRAATARRVRRSRRVIARSPACIIEWSTLGRRGRSRSKPVTRGVALNWRKRMQKRYELRGIRKAFNAFVSVLLRLGIPMGTTYLLTTMGHRSGRAHTTPVALVVDDGRRWLVSPYGEVGWVHNVGATGRARLTPRSSKSISGEIRSP